ncbi:NAD(P)H-dependent amine dehydrogenase family protein [Nocardia jiangxiensis]|uniref:NAD(P)H-dependent amine dehydrogenase family protein n=1 Tax=Nocardia jiangxiensis TaxID=282685 RepID=UPI001FDFDE93|nr:dihydrodipicolinate reductase [Nocardia jiangxiensis]
MGAIATRLMLEQGVEIVGAISQSPSKVGRDLGDVAGLGVKTNVLVESDAAAVLGARAPDIAVVTVSSYLAEMYEHLRLCADNRVNAVTLAEEALYPWRTSPVLTAQLDALARERGVTITGTGQQDVYWVNLVALMMGTAHRVDEVVGRVSWNVDDYGPEVARDQHVGESVETFARFAAGADRPPTFGRNTLDALVAGSGLRVASIENTTRAAVAESEMYSSTLDIKIPTGHVVGFTDIDTIRTVEGPVFALEMTGSVYKEGQGDINDWEIHGEPDLRVVNPAVPTQVTTCTQLVNRIPDVINAAPGFVTVDQLPPLRYRPFPLGAYLAR